KEQSISRRVDIDAMVVDPVYLPGRYKNQRSVLVVIRLASVQDIPAFVVFQEHGIDPHIPPEIPYKRKLAESHYAYQGVQRINPCMIIVLFYGIYSLCLFHKPND